MATGPKRKILLVDDDPALRQSLSEQMALQEDLETTTAATAGTARTAAHQSYFDLVILDVDLPDMDGRDLCRALRQEGLASPVIMLTGMDSDSDAIVGLDAGANDYVTKPFRVGVLLARIRAQLRQYEASQDAVYRIGPYSFQPARKLMVHTSTDKTIRLTDKEAAILRYLYRCGDRVIDRDQLLREVWGYNSNVTTHTLETHVYRLRQKIEPDPQDASILVTQAGGYRLVA